MAARSRRIRRAAAREVDSHSDVCMVCFDGGSLLMCDGVCKRSFHPKCVNVEKLPTKVRTVEPLHPPTYPRGEEWLYDKSTQPYPPNPPTHPKPKQEWLCDDCVFGNMLCLVCGEAGVVNKDVVRCKKPHCGRFYHPACVQGDERVKQFKTTTNSFLCAQHQCTACGEKPPAKPDKENWFLTCLKCPTSLHLHCAIDKPVRVLTHRSMFCDAHVAETAAPVLELANVAHIKYPDRRGIRPQKGRLINAPGEEDDGGGDEEEEDDEEEEASAAAPAAKVSHKKKPAAGGDAAGPPKRGRPPGSGAKKAAAAEEDGGGEEGEGEKKKRKRASRAKKPKVEGLSFASALIGPFRGETYRLQFKAKEKEAAKAEQDGACPCGDEGKKEDFIQCEKCQIWYHLSCAALTSKEAAQITHFYCTTCDKEVEEEEARYEPVISIRYWKAALDPLAYAATKGVESEEEEEEEEKKPAAPKKAAAPKRKRPNSPKPGGGGKSVASSAPASSEEEDFLEDSSMDEEEDDAPPVEKKGKGGKKAGKKAAAPTKKPAGGSRGRASPALSVKTADAGEETEDEEGAPPTTLPAATSSTSSAAGAPGGVVDPSRLYCICRQPERAGDQFIGCDKCQEWFHYSCMGLPADIQLDNFLCPACEEAEENKAGAGGKKKAAAAAPKKGKGKGGRNGASPSPKSVDGGRGNDDEGMEEGTNTDEPGQEVNGGEVYDEGDDEDVRAMEEAEAAEEAAEAAAAAGEEMEVDA